MKVWHGITLTLWVILMSLCTTTVLYNQAIQRTVLNVEQSKKWLADSTTYDDLRDVAVGNMVVTTVNERYPGNTLIDRALIDPVLAEVLPRSELIKRINPVVDDLYRWLDSKEPSVVINLSFEDKRDQLYRSLETKLATRIKALPKCDDYRYPPEEAILIDGCLPSYVTAGEATQAAMGSIRTFDLPLSIKSDNITPTSADSNTAIKRIPTYLNYLWVVNLIAIAVLIYLALLVLITRRVVGIVAIGASMVIAGILLLTGQVGLTHLTLPDLGEYSAAIQTAIDTLVPKLARLIAIYGIAAVVGGLVMIAGGGTWLWSRRRGVPMRPAVVAKPKPQQVDKEK